MKNRVLAAIGVLTILMIVGYVMWPTADLPLVSSGNSSVAEVGIASSSGDATENPPGKLGQERSVSAISPAPISSSPNVASQWEALRSNALRGDPKSLETFRDAIARCGYLNSDEFGKLMALQQSNNPAKYAAFMVLVDQCKYVYGLTVEQIDEKLALAAEQANEFAIAARLHEIEMASGRDKSNALATQIYSSSNDAETVALAAEHLRQQGWNLGADEYGSELPPGELRQLQYYAIQQYRCAYAGNCGANSPVVLEACALAGACLSGADFDTVLRTRLLSPLDYSRVSKLFRMMRKPGAQGGAATS